MFLRVTVASDHNFSSFGFPMSPKYVLQRTHFFSNLTRPLFYKIELTIWTVDFLRDKVTYWAETLHGISYYPCTHLSQQSFRKYIEFLRF